MSLKITISGHAACGQAIVARVIELALKECGSIVDVDYRDHRPSETGDIINRIHSLHGKKISIEMEQLKRVGCANSDETGVGKFPPNLKS